MKATLYAAAACAAAIAALPADAEEIKLTAISGHPPVTLGVSHLRDYYIPEVNKRLEAAGKHKIVWTEAYGGSVAKPAAVLEAIEKADPRWFGQDAKAARDRLLRRTFTAAVDRLQALPAPQRQRAKELELP